VSLPAGNQRRDKSDEERHPDWPELQQPLNECCFVHVAVSLRLRVAMLAGDGRRPVRNAGDAKTGIGMTATTVIDAMSAYHEVVDEPHAPTRHARRHGFLRLSSRQSNNFGVTSSSSSAPFKMIS